MFVRGVCLLQHEVDEHGALLAVLLAVDGVDGTAHAALQAVVELGVLAVAASGAEKRVLLVIIYRPKHKQCYMKKPTEKI